MTSSLKAFLLILGLSGQLFAADAVPTPKAPAGPLTPAESLKHFQLAPGLELEQLLAEPLVSQPVFVTFDERGRLWCVQYRQYPHPAGLKMLSRDKFWRAVYDRVPPAPPHHFPGKDKVTIHEDTDGDGRFDTHKTFVEGLNIVTSVAFGRGGVWVLNPPYLLFYADRNRDDIPDGDPEVHLEGFGLEDTHSVANSLRWGPDGWLYAAQGSTVTGNIKRPGLDKQGVASMGQLIWRYHPETRRYEIFAEGGGNAFGVELDSQGHIFSGHNGGDTRGFHYVQGGYSRKGFTKHGPLSNPYAFGFFDAMRHNQAPRFTHTFVIDAGGQLPETYRGKLFGVAPLQSEIVLSDVQRDGSSFKTLDLSPAVTSSDPWFRPVDIKTGPDGALYLADWYDGQVNHYRNHEGQIDPENGRIYRLQAKGAKPLPPFDLAQLTLDQLVARLADPNIWQRQTVLRLIADRQDTSAVPALTRLVEQSRGQLALEALWALNLSGGFNEALALTALEHPEPSVRSWTVRLLGDSRQVSRALAAKLAARALVESSVDVRSQLASSAKRLPAEDCLPIVLNQLTRDEDIDDIHLPLLLWWALEAKLTTEPEAVFQAMGDPKVWGLPMSQRQILERLMRRVAATGSRKDLLQCARLLQLAPNAESARRLMIGFEAAFEGRPLPNLPPELVTAIARLGGESLVLALRQGKVDAVAKALEIVRNDQADKTQRLQFVQIFGEISQPSSVPTLMQLAESGAGALRNAALTALLQYDNADIATRVIKVYNALPEDGRSVAQTLLASRAGWALSWLEAVDRGEIDRRSIPLEVVRKIQAHRDEKLIALVTKYWGQVQGETSEEMRRQITRLTAAIRGGSGDPYSGKKVFNASCAKCHLLFALGGKIGPDLTSYKRDDLDVMLLSVVNPSAEIREGFENFVVLTDDGRSLNGFLADHDSQVVVIRGQDGQNVVIPRDRIEEMNALRTSLMPERLLNDLNDQQVRDLFAYLRSSQPLND